MQTYTNSVHHPLIESLVQSTPAATSTPNPIQQQQQSVLNQDIITNLFLKFDPASFFPSSKKDQLSLIASTLANAQSPGPSSNTSINNNTSHQARPITNNQTQQSIMHANNLASFNNLLNSNNSSTADKQANNNNTSDGNSGQPINNKASKKILLNANMSSQLQQQQFIKMAGQQQNQQQK